MSIIELNELALNRWKALYEGNYGIYNIRLTYDDVNASDYSCSCCGWLLALQTHRAMTSFGKCARNLMRQ